MTDTFSLALRAIVDTTAQRDLDRDFFTVTVAHEAALHAAERSLEDVAAAANAAAADLLDRKGWSPFGPDDFRTDRTDEPCFPFYVLSDEDQHRRAEEEATSFGLAMTMPRAALNAAWLGTGGDIVSIAQHFRVTPAVAVGGLLQAGILGLDHPMVTAKLVRLDENRRKTFEKRCREARTALLAFLSQADTKARTGIANDDVLLRRLGESFDTPLAFLADANYYRTAVLKMRPEVGLVIEVRRLSFLAKTMREQYDMGKTRLLATHTIGTGSLAMVVRRMREVIADAPLPLPFAIQRFEGGFTANRWLDWVVAMALGWTFERSEETGAILKTCPPKGVTDTEIPAYTTCPQTARTIPIPPGWRYDEVPVDAGRSVVAVGPAGQRLGPFVRKEDETDAGAVAWAGLAIRKETGLAA